MKTHKISIAVGNKIRTRREEMKFSQEGFADFINLDRSNYGAIERGERNISISTLARIAIGLEIEVGALFPAIIEIKKIL